MLIYWDYRTGIDLTIKSGILLRVTVSVVDNETPKEWQPVGVHGSRDTYNEFDGELGTMWSIIQRGTNPIEYKNAPRTVYYPSNPTSKYDENISDSRVNVTKGLIDNTEPPTVINIGSEDGFISGSLNVRIPKYLIPPKSQNQTAPQHFEYLDVLKKDSGLSLIYEN